MPAAQVLRWSKGFFGCYFDGILMGYVIPFSEGAILKLWKSRCKSKTPTFWVLSQFFLWFLQICWWKDSILSNWNGSWGACGILRSKWLLFGSVVFGSPGSANSNSQCDPKWSNANCRRAAMMKAPWWSHKPELAWRKPIYKWTIQILVNIWL